MGNESSKDTTALLLSGMCMKTGTLDVNSIGSKESVEWISFSLVVIREIIIAITSEEKFLSSDNIE